jgi:predicted CoA-binding protein
VGAALIVVPPARSRSLVQECVRLGIRNVWLQQGAESPEAVREARDAGLDCVARECVLMYAHPRGIHRLHRWIHDWRRSPPQRGI